MLFAFHADAEENYVSDQLHPSRFDPSFYETNEIRFEGNNAFSDSDLLGIILTRTSSLGLIDGMLVYFSDQFEQIESTPQLMQKAFLKTTDKIKEEINYFDKAKAENDRLSLETFYNKNGFHISEVYYTFLPDSLERKNILTFHIREGNRARLDTIVYIGLDSLPEWPRIKVRDAKRLRAGGFFNEDELVREIGRIQNALLNNGYFFAYYEKPPLVITDTTDHTDSVTVVFYTGRRQKISDITMIDSLKGQPKVQTKMKYQQLEFDEGEWYSREDVMRSEANLRYLGTFDLVAIDTTSEFVPQTDSTLNMRVFTQYRKLREWGFGLFLNRTAYDNVTNIGVEGSFVHRNTFGKCQVFNPYGRLILRDISRLLSGEEPEFEMQLGLKFGQPLLWIIDNSRFGLFFNPLYSIRSVRVLNSTFQLNTITLPIKFQITFPGYTYFKNGSVDFLFERQVPVNFDNAIKNALKDAQTEDDSTRVLEPLLLYSSLNDWIKEGGTLTANLIGGSIVADNRDNVFSPTKGDFATISLDGWNPMLAFENDWSGLSKFYRFQFAYYRFDALSPRSILAVKGRLGYIYLIDKQDPYIPFERQFFAGGANSIRGWPSRKLRYTKLDSEIDLSDGTYEFLQDFVGSRGLVEISMELRQRFKRPKGMDKLWANQIANLGITWFLDIGNAYNWLADDDDLTDTKFLDVFTKLGYAAGLGLRYETPIGPIRFDLAWPIYDPNKDPGLIFSRESGLDKWQFHIALGHAF